MASGRGGDREEEVTSRKARKNGLGRENSMGAGWFCLCLVGWFFVWLGGWVWFCLSTWYKLAFGKRRLSTEKIHPSDCPIGRSGVFFVFLG